jgi:eukaryotic-like serine/threonine-protein kinase
VLERQLGRGGMATVYLARDLKHDRPVALKVLHPELAASLGPERFLQEIRLAARLQHPHVLTVFDSGEGNGHLWFTMPYVEGESLRDRLRREASLSVSESLRIAREAGQALQYAHEHGVVHRDVKPENILLTKDGSTLVADFGIARALETPGPQLTATGIVVGTPIYMSPEQAGADAPVDGRSDVYSLGCVLYEMIAGRPPFTGQSLQALVAKHLSQTPPPIVRSGGVPAAVSEAISRALAKSPHDRFATAADFVRALDRAAVEDRQSAPRWFPGKITAAAFVGVAAVIGAIVVIGQLTRPETAVPGSNPSGPRRLAQLTVAGGVEEWPAWSPDGTRLVYSGEADGVKQLFLRVVGSGEERRLTKSGRDDIQPAWSPDGKRLAFVRAGDARSKLEPSDINAWYFENGDIWTLDLDSGREARLIGDAFGPSWSPDGNRIAFDARWAAPRRIWVSDARGRNPRQVTSDSNDAVVHAGARWSPDGRHLVFRRMDNTKWDIATVDPATSRMERLTNDIMPDLDPVWSPDGRIYFVSARGGGLNLWRMPLDDSGAAAGPAEQLTTGAGDDLQPAVSPDGRRIAFAVRGINSGIWRLPISPTTGRPTGSPTPLVTSSRVESRGAWSPDGHSIAFNSDRRGDMNLWVRSLSDGAERSLTSGPGGDYQPNWSPDGRSIAFFSSRAGNADIWTVSVADGALTQLTDDPGTDTNPFYSPDGRSIAFESDRDGRAEVWVMNADGSNQRKLYDGAAGGHFLRWTHDGRSVVFRAESGAQTHVLSVSLTGGEGKQLPSIASGAHMSFSPDESLILDVRGHKSLWVHPLNGAAAYPVFEFSDPDVRIDYPVWSPDGRWMLFDRTAPRSGDIWMLEGTR